MVVRFVSACLVACLLSSCKTSSVVAPSVAQIEPSPSPDAVWPWKGAAETKAYPGVTRWFQKATSDGTELELFEFDFGKNPNLSFQIYDQDEDDSQPFDNKVDYFPRGVGHVVKHLHSKDRGKVLAAWNGLFFGYDRGPGSPPQGWAIPIGPTVLLGKMHHNVGRHRWMFGVKVFRGKPQFKTTLLPERDRIEREFDFAADAAQCLIREGKPTHLEPFPGKKKADPPGLQDAGHIPLVDYMKTSRTSLGWSKDSSKLYLLVVNEPDTEVESKMSLKRGQASKGGWMLSDLQRFWKSFGAWGAINSDGGMPTQSIWLRPDGKYEMLPSRSVAPSQRLVFDKNLEGTPEGGTLLTFYICDQSKAISSTTPKDRKETSPRAPGR